MDVKKKFSNSFSGNSHPPAFRGPPRSRVAWLGLALALLAAAAAAISGLGHRWGWWDFGTGFTVLKWAFFAGLAACAVSALGAVLARPAGPRRGFAAALSGLAIGAAVVWIPWQSLQQIRVLPPIHDITTDPLDPPSFSAVLPLRGDESNSTDYAGPAIAALQQQGYPDIQPIDVSIDGQRAFTLALEVVRDLGWEVVASEPATGRIEATDTTLWFGFKDDVVIRVASHGQMTRIDLRSVSRVGGSDAGANAKRIRKFIRSFNERL